MRRFVPFLLLAWLAAACTPGGVSRGVYSPPVATGDRVVVLEPIPVAPDYARVYLQDGAPVSYLGMNQYAPQCSFVLERPRPVRQFVQPGEYRVTRVRQEDTEIVQAMPVRLAARAGWRGDGEILLATLVTMELEGPQPELRELQCSGAFASPFDVRPPTREEIARALGGLARLVSGTP